MIFIIGPLPRSPPKSSISPSLYPIAGITLTAVVLEFTIPIAASSAIIAEIVVEGTFETYREDGDENLYCRLSDAILQQKN